MKSKSTSPEKPKTPNSSSPPTLRSQKTKSSSSSPPDPPPNNSKNHKSRRKKPFSIEVLRRRNRGKTKSVAQKALKYSERIELSLGDINQFTGRRYSSASLQLNDKWDFTTQIDEEGESRALLIFSIRFR